MCSQQGCFQRQIALFLISMKVAALQGSPFASDYEVKIAIHVCRAATFIRAEKSAKKCLCYTLRHVHSRYVHHRPQRPRTLDLAKPCRPERLMAR